MVRLSNASEAVRAYLTHQFILRHHQSQIVEKKFKWSAFLYCFQAKTEAKSKGVLLNER